MIARIWSGRTPAAQAEAYLEVLKRTGERDYRATPGNRGVYILRQVEGGEARFITLTLWDSIEAVRAFAGEDPTRARYYPDDDAYLIERTPTVEHYEVCVAG